MNDVVESFSCLVAVGGGAGVGAQRWCAWVFLGDAGAPAWQPCATCAPPWPAMTPNTIITLLQLGCGPTVRPQMVAWHAGKPTGLHWAMVSSSIVL